MKKLLLLGALGAMVFGAQAESFGDYFKLTYHGEELTDGQTILVTEGVKTDWGGGMVFIEMAHVNIDVEPVNGEPTCMLVGYFYDEPTASAWGSYADPKGMAQLCFANAYVALADGVVYRNNCLNIEFGMKPLNAGPDPSKQLQLQLHRTDITEEAANEKTKFRLYLQACDGDAESDYEAIDDADFTVYIEYAYHDSSVAELDAENASALYYTLDGRQLTSAPESGLYIEKRAGKVAKRIAR